MIDTYAPSDPSWVLDDKVKLEATKTVYKVYRITEVDGRRVLSLRFEADRLLFNGLDIETEEFMAYVGLMDTIDDLIGDRSLPAKVALETI